MRALLCLLLALVLSGCGGVRQETFSKVALRPQNGAIMFSAPILPYRYQIWFSPLQADREVGNAVMIPIFPQGSVTFPSTGHALKLVSVKPGRQIVRLVSWQGHWGACLAQGTIGFDVEPGKIAYLGTVDPTPSLASIEAEARRSGKTMAQGAQLRLFRKNVVPPVFSLAAAPTAEEALDVARANGLAAALPVSTPQAVPATFHSKNDTDLFGYCD